MFIGMNKSIFFKLMIILSFVFGLLFGSKITGKKNEVEVTVHPISLISKIEITDIEYRNKTVTVYFSQEKLNDFDTLIENGYLNTIYQIPVSCQIQTKQTADVIDLVPQKKILKLDLGKDQKFKLLFDIDEDNPELLFENLEELDVFFFFEKYNYQYIVSYVAS